MRVRGSRRRRREAGLVPRFDRSIDVGRPSPAGHGRHHPSPALTPYSHTQSKQSNNRRWTIFKGDKVEVINGPEKGKQGTVLKVLRAQNRVVVEGVNVVRSLGGLALVVVCKLGGLYWPLATGH